MRKGSIKRTTKETDIEVELDLDGRGKATISTGIGFLDHMLDLLARHSRIDIFFGLAIDIVADFAIQIFVTAFPQAHNSPSSPKGRMMRAMASVNRSHFEFSAASCFRPLAVRL